MDTRSFDLAARQLNLYRDRLLSLPDSVKARTSDIRYGTGQPVALWGRDGVRYLTTSGTTGDTGPDVLISTQAQLQELFMHICGRSVFSHEQEIREGYVQMGGGCRAGICGRAVLEDGRVRSMRDITSIVVRIPREVPGCADRLLGGGLPWAELSRGLLIAGEPGSGKTTLLRDIARSLSMGRFGPSRRVAVLDTRGELSPGFDLGPSADVLLSVPKGAGFQMAIRVLSPDVLICDELAPEDLPAVRASVFAGVGLIATVHAHASDPLSRPFIRELAGAGAFRTMVALRGRDSPFGIGELRRIRPGGVP